MTVNFQSTLQAVNNNHSELKSENPTTVLQPSARVRELMSKIFPITEEYKDKDGRRLRLWALPNIGFCGTALYPDGKTTLIPLQNIINPLSKTSAITALHSIQNSKQRRWDLVYVETTQQLIVWPYSIAAGKDEIEGASTIERKEGIEKLQPIRFIEDRVKLGHIFRKEKGHLQHDTPQNRQYILNAVSNPSNKVGMNKFGIEIYLKVMSDGSQAWAYVKEGYILNGGRNEIPLTWIIDNTHYEGGKFTPLKYLTYKPNEAGFKERVQLNKLSADYNLYHTHNPIPQHKTEKSRIGGVRNETGIILNLFDNLKTEDENEHIFFIPASEGLSLKEEQIQQMLHELAIGIFVYDTVPFFSLHFNSDMQLYPVIHPAYQNTLIGYAISMLDYFMKGFSNGVLYDVEFVQQWKNNRTMDKQFLEQKGIDLHAYCTKHLGESYYSFREIISHLENQEKTSSSLSTADSIKGDYRNFNCSFVITAKQNSIWKTANLFLLDGTFDLDYSIKTLSGNADLQEPYTILDKACQIMKDQIKKMMPRLPDFKWYFEALNFINFFTYYYNTLKKANKIPALARKTFPNDTYTCPPAFPPFPVQSLARKEIDIKITSLFGLLPKNQQLILSKCIQALDSSKEQQEVTVENLANALRDYTSTPSASYRFEDLAYNKVVALDILQKCQSQYQSLEKKVDEGLALAGLKNRGEKITEGMKKQLHTQLQGLIPRIDKDIDAKKYQIQQNQRLNLPYNTLLFELAQIEKEKEGLVHQNRMYESWFQDPISVCFANTLFHFDIVTHCLRLSYEKTKDKIAVAGGFGMGLENKQAENTPIGETFLAQHTNILSNLPYEAVVNIQDSTKNQIVGAVFKLPFEDFPIACEEEREAAAAYLYPPHYKYSMNNAVVYATHAIFTNDEQLFRKAASEIEDWNFQDSLGVSLVHYAAAAINPFFLDFLIQRKARLDIRDIQGFIAHHYAARTGSLHCLELLIRESPQLINTPSLDGDTPLYVAAQNNQLSCVQLLLQKRADPNLKTCSGMNALLCAIPLKSPDLIHRFSYS